MNSDLNTIFLELENRLLKPEVRSSSKELDLLLADDFVEIGSSGSIYFKKDTLERLPASREQLKITISDFNSKSLTPDLVMTNFKTEKYVNDGPANWSQRTSIWRNDNNIWKMIFHQGTLITPQ